MRRTKAAAGLAPWLASMALFLLPPVAPAGTDGVFTIVDTLGVATPESRFGLGASVGTTISGTQISGPEIVLTEPTLITEIGGFLDDVRCEVQIRPSRNGLPDPSTILAAFPLSDAGDPDFFTYRSVHPDVVLEAGTYFALFAPRSADEGGTLLNGATEPFLYEAESAIFGFLDPTTGTTTAFLDRAAARVLGTEAEIIAVDIDIEPHREPNRIKARGRINIRVAILSSPELDAPGDVDPRTLTFGRTGAEDSLVRRGRQARPVCRVMDVNRDGLADLVCTFDRSKTGLEAEDIEAVLKGHTVSGLPIRGRDSVEIVSARR